MRQGRGFPAVQPRTVPAARERREEGWRAACDQQHPEPFVSHGEDRQIDSRRCLKRMRGSHVGKALLVLLTLGPPSQPCLDPNRGDG
jgi:hypothetical protein